MKPDLFPLSFRPRQALFLLLLSLAALAPQTAPALQVAPIDEQETPAWFRLWREARALRDHDERQASAAYQRLLAEKPDLQEARWEYCQMLAAGGLPAGQAGTGGDATAICEPLTETNPNNQDYLLMTGRLALAAKDYDRAVSYLQKCADAGGSRRDEATRLLVDALEHLGETKKSLPYLESLAQAHPNDLELAWRLFVAARQTGDRATAVAEAISLSKAEALSPARLLETASYLEKVGDQAAIAARERYLRLRPDYAPFHRSLAAAYLAGKAPDRKKALPHLLALAESGDASDSQILDLARLYHLSAQAGDQEAFGRALHYLELACGLRPDDAALTAETLSLRRQFAKNLLADMRRDGAQDIWDDLDHLEIDRLALYAALAEEMEKSGKRKRLLQLLSVLRDKSPQPDRYTLRIARLLAAADDEAGALNMMRQVEHKEFRDAGYFRERAALAARLNQIEEALADYSQALALKPGDTAVREEAIILAARAGSARQLFSFAPPNDAPLPLWLAWLNGLADQSLFTKATEECGALLAKARFSSAEKRQLREWRAGARARMGRLAEAEQEYRLLMAENGEVSERRRLLLQVIELLARGRDHEEAEKWLALAVEGDHGSPLDERFALARWRLNLQKDTSGAAIDRLREHIDGLAATNASARARLTPWRLLLAEGCLARRDQAGAQAALAADASGAGDDHDDHERAALRLLVGNTTGRSGPNFAATQLAERLGLFDVANTLTQAALAARPEALAARATQARLAKERGHFAEAARQYADLRRAYPGEAFFQREYLTALLASGQTAVFRQELAKHPVIFPALEEELLLARADWQDGKRGEALKGYETVLSALFPDQDVAGKEHEDSLWRIFSFSDPEELARLEHATDPARFWRAEATEAQARAQEFAQRRFEKTVRHEYMARRSLVSRQYRSAERQYRRNLQNEPTVSAWRDLADIYERLGQYGKEAEIYSALSEQGQDNAELRGAMAKNRLLRAPRLSLDWGRRSQEGRDGMKNLRENSMGLRSWLMPSLTSEVTVSAENIQYDTVSSDAQSVTGRRLRGKVGIALTENSIFVGETGFHTTEAKEEGDTVMLYDFSLRHRFDPLLQGFVRLRQEVLDDTLTSVTRGYSRQGYEGGLELDAPSGFALGAEFAHNRLESDNNENRLNLWAGYSVFGEFSTISLKYEYRIARQDQTGIPRADQDAGRDRNSLPYWSPGEYWLQQASASFRYLLAGLGFPGQNDSYYSLSLSTGYESDDSPLVTGAFDISLELTRHFLLKGNLLFSKADDYKEQGGFLSLVYRW
jgi:tetratricopeptide (TPR) repeat protein